MAESLQECVEALSSSGLVSTEELDGIIGQLPEGSRSGDSRALLQELVKRHRLTPFQADVLAGESAQLVIGDHVLLERIGQGGMGVVYKAYNRRMDRVVALKVLAEEEAQSARAVDRFNREVRAAARLSHPNIIAAYDAGELDGTHYLVMEYVEGGDLRRLVRRRGPFTAMEAVELLIQAARGLQFAHTKGVVHRDVNPANLMLDEAGTLKILDLGLAQVDASADLTRTGEGMGTEGYIAPEQSEDTKNADHRADIYSLGCTLYYLVTGKKAAQQAGAPRRIPEVAQGAQQDLEALQVVFERMVAERPEDRYDTMSDVVAALLPLNEQGELGSVISQLSTSRAHGNSKHVAKPRRASRGGALIRWGLVAGVCLTLVSAGWLAATSDSRNLPPIATATFSAEQAREFQDDTARFLGCKRELINSIGMEFVLLPAHAGAKPDQLIKPCYLGAHEVSQKLYFKLMGENPSVYQIGGKKLPKDVANTSRFPVENITRDQALAFCRKVSELPAEKEAGRVYRLPFGSEWEFGCRAGTSQPLAEDEELLGRYAWFDLNSGNRPHSVGTLSPNAFGLYDMLGNVEEWGADEQAGRILLVGTPFWKWARHHVPDAKIWLNNGSRQSDVGFRIVCETPEIRDLKVPRGG